MSEEVDPDDDVDITPQVKEEFHPGAFEIVEVRILLAEGRNELYVLLGRNGMGEVGGWWRHFIEPRRTLAVLHNLLATGELGEEWEKGGATGTNGSYVKVKGAGCES